jgi:pimeloyl-ACP methyl ester carboxylesterase
MWSPQLAPLAEAGFRVLAPDFPGFGESRACSDGFTIDSAADMISEFLQALAIPRAVVAGLSMGGYVALAFARRHSDQLAGLILADTRAAADDAAAKEARNNTIATVKAKGAAAVGASMLPKVLSEQSQANPAILGLARTLATRQSAEGVIAALTALRDRPDAVASLNEIAVPTLVLVGEHDAITPPLLAARLGANIRGSELIHIPGAGHLSNLENPSAFNQAVLAFLKRMR